jgi:hypothetical protein
MPLTLEFEQPRGVLSKANSKGVVWDQLSRKVKTTLALVSLHLSAQCPRLMERKKWFRDYRGPKWFKKQFW